MSTATSVASHGWLGSTLISLVLLGAVERARAEPESAAPVVEFTGTCDASGAVPIDARRFAIAGDEDNVLRIYDAEHGGPPVDTIDVSAELGLNGKNPEADLEAATRLGERALWISSHARTNKARVDPDRFRFFSTNLPRPGAAVTVSGTAYRDLLSDLLADPRLRELGLEASTRKAPEQEGGFNLEGMTATPDGQVLLGFRNPIPRGRALLVAIVDPLATLRGERARLGDPIQLDLGGMGVRGLSYWRGRYLIAAGPHGDDDSSRLYTWKGPGTAPEAHEQVAIEGFRAEAFFTPEQVDRFMLFSDDGSRVVSGRPCKELANASERRFRGVWLSL
jgi:hypothetical protein